IALREIIISHPQLGLRRQTAFGELRDKVGKQHERVRLVASLILSQSALKRCLWKRWMIRIKQKPSIKFLNRRGPIVLLRVTVRQPEFCFRLQSRISKAIFKIEKSQSGFGG